MTGEASRTIGLRKDALREVAVGDAFDGEGERRRTQIRQVAALHLIQESSVEVGVARRDPRKPRPA